MKRFLKFLWPFLTFLSMLFILVNGTSTSGKAIVSSSDIAGVIEDQVSSITHQDVSFSSKDRVKISKIGHFLEYGAFALFLSLSAFSWGGKPEALVFHILFCTVFLALTDEQIQFLILDRGSRVSDVIIDLAGGFAGYGTAYLSCMLWERRKRK